MSDPAPARLFTYGSLQPGAANDHVLDGLAGTWEPATIRGSLVEDGWAAPIGYPAVTLDPEGGPVAGMLFTSDDLVHHWPRLDAFGGEGYDRQIAQVERDDGSPVSAHVYVLRSG